MNESTRDAKEKILSLSNTVPTLPLSKYKSERVGYLREEVSIPTPMPSRVPRPRPTPRYPHINQVR